jgi:hypothetical protein
MVGYVELARVACALAPVSLTREVAAGSASGRHGFEFAFLAGSRAYNECGRVFTSAAGQEVSVV